MSSANATTCSLVALVLDSTALRAAGWCEIALSALCLAAFAYTHGYRRCEPLAPLHANLKVLLYFTVIICLLNATSALAVQLAHEVACTERVHTRQRGGRLQDHAATLLSRAFRRRVRAAVDGERLHRLPLAVSGGWRTWAREWTSRAPLQLLCGAHGLHACACRNYR